MTAIELAPGHKVGLTLESPVMPAAGCYGFGAAYTGLIDVESLGAVVIGPVTSTRRLGADALRMLAVPGGLLLHTGLANPGVAAVARYVAHTGQRISRPFIVHVAGTSPSEVATCCHQLSGIEAVGGIELGLPDAVYPDEAIDLVRAAAEAATQPVIVRLPLADADVLCEVAVESGGAALTVAAPPRGTAWHAASGRFITGRLYGPFVQPMALRAIRRVSQRVPVPVIGCGGIHSATDARAFIQAGAAAIQVSGALWRDPACLQRIARQLATPAARPTCPGGQVGPTCPGGQVGVESSEEHKEEKHDCT